MIAVFSSIKITVHICEMIARINEKV